MVMMMTIWWSKATRLLEFSRYLGSLYQRYAGTRLFCDAFCVTDGRIFCDGRIGYSSSWMCTFLIYLDMCLC